MKKYWEEFNKIRNTDFEVGISKKDDSNGPYKDLKNLRINPINPNLTCNIQVVSSFSKQQLFIKIKIVNKGQQDLKSRKNEWKQIEQKIKREGFSLLERNTPEEKEKKSSVITIASISLCELENVTEVEDQRTSPNRPIHFEWFNENLNRLKNVLNQK